MQLNTLCAGDVERILNDKSLFSDLLNNNSGIVHSIIKQLKHPNDPELVNDLYQEGCEGLYKALTKYDPEKAKGANFGTFAYRIIRNKLLQYIEKNYK